MGGQDCRRCSGLIVSYQFHRAAEAVASWNRALGAAFPMRLSLWRQQTESDPNFRPEDARLLEVGGQAVGGVLTKRLRALDSDCEGHRSWGWVAALWVEPEHRRQGFGSQLLHWAEAYLQSAGCQRIGLGGSFQHFFPGLPVGQPALLPFFSGHGYRIEEEPCHDLITGLDPDTVVCGEDARRTLADRSYRASLGTEGDRDRFLDFMGDAFPGRWRYEQALTLEQGGRMEEQLLLHTSMGEIVGFVHLHFPGESVIRPSLFWATLLEEPTGGIGPLGIHPIRQRQGLGELLVSVALGELARRGIRVCVVDWTNLMAFYGRWGFRPWKSYRRASKELKG